MKVPWLGVESELELQLLASATATATADLSFVYNLCCNLRQHWILKPLSEASDLTCIFMTLCWVFFFFCLFAFSRGAPTVYGGSQARGLIRAVAASLHHSHSNAGSEPCLRPTPWLTATLYP